MRKYLVLFLLICTQWGYCQEDLFSLIEEPEMKVEEPVSATFKGTKIINNQSNEIPAKGVLQFVILHRFGSLKNDFLYNFFGLDNAQVRFSLDYSPLSWLNIGVGRASLFKMTDIWYKAPVIKQIKNGWPVGITLYGSANINGLRWPTDGLERLFTDRLIYVHQILLSHKANENFSILVAPTLVHYNLRQTASQPNSLAVLTLGGRYKLSKRVSLNAEYSPMINRNTGWDGSQSTPFTNALSIGFDIETGGHVFQLHITNSRGLSDPVFLTQTSGSWMDGEIYFGFNISRVFTVKPPKI
ncbi:DUF5777 family beta-barrel protein [Schleiferia thermophila]|jgi:hypothetical protein|uniref:DUF5777 domain-containing protein n=1 Tax=Schleiferia thermophila TaxID=884107 RepID=A0A369A2Y3_9FLAO|nr:DUF5777 family beta-barrel protein [Schleiferia thermophila]KFD38473.1 hypothetical protein AT05_09490 [Schleiferia thermophila str. Yellowstone]RCX03569.1 hypothetical protein DES35_10218 [Schleiferia thermophila]GCD79805.1 hypothetical protein JCM30197_10520 [Schleiferia thermophila]